ncbi:hypothetical protein PSACC_00465 [Paramicrosporidium saccamoebae]|uniref:Uncharacterized protein n=1 Tax=Paramicrosporidium saccamoebae TaxID=1246581 RepID=A0A2H9TPR0_9FUNG|nr:hypothetical protein PSACC_00465 [Paramicrosporidium saccamoebae]
MSPTKSPRRRSVDEMLCPICEDDCSCTGQTELHIKKSPKPRKRPSATFHGSRGVKTAKTTVSGDLDAQFALSEYYFSEEDSCVDDTELFAEYYGYSSGSDIAIESLFLHTDSSSEEEDLEMEPLMCVSKTQEETLSEQLAKITPQILAAISMAAKSSVCTAPAVIPTHRVYHVDDYPGLDNCLRLEELMDTAKLAMILSTSPPAPDSRPPQRRIPLDAFRRRRNSVTHITGAFRAGSVANCMLAAMPEGIGRRKTEPEMREWEGQADDEDNSTESLEDDWLPVPAALWSFM